MLVFVLGANYYAVFPTNDSQAYRLVLAAGFLTAALLLRRGKATRAYGQIAYAFFIAITAFFVTSLTAGTRDALLQSANVSAATPRHMALSKIAASSQNT